MLFPKVLNKKSVGNTSHPGLNKIVIVSGDVKVSDLEDHQLAKDSLWQSVLLESRRKSGLLCIHFS